LLLFSGDIAVENPDDASDVGNQCFCLQRFPCRGRAPKMKLVYHCVLQNDPDSQRYEQVPWIFESIARTLPEGAGEKKRPNSGLGRSYFSLAYAVTRSVSRQKIADGHPRSVGSVKNQRISQLELLLHGIAAKS
jgi:hypothetical protein